jgi:hypothetical protein
MGDNVSTDEILKAGDVLISNIPEISKYSYSVIDPVFYDRAMTSKKNLDISLLQKKIMPKVLAGNMPLLLLNI